MTAFGSAVSDSSGVFKGAVSEEKLRYGVNFLSGELCGGRATGTHGAVEASAWIARQFDSYSLPDFGSRFQSFGVGEKAGHNVLASLQGRSDRWIVVCAYYDGIGTVDGEIYPGADSNASGVAALLELSRLMPRALEKGIIFVALDAHNEDYSGARALLDILPSKKVDMIVNLDILGCTLAPVNKLITNYIIALGGRDIYGTFTIPGKECDMWVHYDYYGSYDFTKMFYEKIGDQSVFLEKKFPCIVFTSGITMNTNNRNDKPRTIDYEIFRRRVEFIGMWLESICSK